MSMNLNSVQQKAAERAAQAIADIIGVTSRVYPDPASRLTFVMSTALPGVMGAVQGLCKDATEDSFMPNGDHVLFTCLMIANSTTRCGNIQGRGQGFMVEYSCENVLKTMQDFQNMTGRSFEPMMNESLVECVHHHLEDAEKAFTGDMTKFRPQ